MKAGYVFRRHGRLYIAFFAATFLLMTFQGRTAPLRPFGFMGALNDAINLAYKSTKNASEELMRATVRDQAELERLREQVRALRLMELRFRHIELENERLKRLLGISPGGFTQVAVARVIARSPERWSNAVVIDQGESGGVRKDMAVITQDGLAGKVTRTTGSTATVLLLDDARFSASARLGDSRAEVVYAGIGHGQGIIKYLPEGLNIGDSEQIYTSGLDGLFPPGIRIAMISNASGQGGEMFQKVTVVPYVDTRKLEEVIVVAR